MCSRFTSNMASGFQACDSRPFHQHQRFYGTVGSTSQHCPDLRAIERWKTAVFTGLNPAKHVQVEGEKQDVTGKNVKPRN